IIIIYPFIFWVSIVKRQDLVAFNSFFVPLSRYLKTYEISIIKTRNGNEFLVSDILFWNYRKLVDKICRNVKYDPSLVLWKVKHVKIAVIVFVIVIISFAILAS